MSEIDKDICMSPPTKTPERRKHVRGFLSETREKEQMTRKQFYKTKAWLQCRDGYIKSVRGLCERCLKDGKVVTGYIVHHKVYLNEENINDPTVTLNWDNLEYLCFDCHNKEHFKEKIVPRYRVNDDGTVEII